MPECGIGDIGKFQEQFIAGYNMCRGCHGLRRQAAVDGRQRICGVAENLRELFIPRGKPSLHHQNLIGLQIGAAGVQNLGEAQQFYRGSVVLHSDIGHQGVVLCGLGLTGRHHTGNGHMLFIPEPDGTSLLPEVLQNRPDGGRIQLMKRLPIGVHRVPGEIETRGLLLHIHQFLGAELRNIWQVNFLYSISTASISCRN